MKSVFLFVLFLSLSTIVHSQETIVKTPLSTHKTCQLNPKKCLEILPEQLQKIPSGSAAWFRLKDYQMWAEYHLAQYEALGITTNEALNAANPPGDFEFASIIYRAKYLLTVDKDAEAFDLMQRAKKRFAELDSSSSDPSRLLLYANLIQEEAHRLKKHAPREVYRAKFLEARNVLLKVRKNYKNLNDPVFQSNMYANLGHIASALENYVKFLEYRSRGLFWAKQTKNPLRIATAHYNLARAYQANRKHKKAISEYQISVEEHIRARDESGIAICQLRIAQNHIELGNLKEAKALLSKVSESPYKYQYEDLFNELNERLAQ